MRMAAPGLGAFWSPEKLAQLSHTHTHPLLQAFWDTFSATGATPSPQTPVPATLTIPWAPPYPTQERS